MASYSPSVATIPTELAIQHDSGEQPTITVHADSFERVKSEMEYELGGTYFTGLEGSLRVPFIIRWPGKIPAGRVSNEIVHEMDLFPTLVAIVGGKVPTDRAIDGVDQSNFFLGKQEKSKRDGFVVYVGNEIYGVKWQNWRMMFKELETGTGAVEQWSIPRIFNLYLDPKEEHPLSCGWENGWVRWPASKILSEDLKSLHKCPPIRPGTPDPYARPSPEEQACVQRRHNAFGILGHLHSAESPTHCNS